MMRIDLKKWETKSIYRIGNMLKLSIEYAGDIVTSMIFHNDRFICRNC